MLGPKKAHRIPDYRRVHDEYQKTLIEFLNTDLDLGSMFASQLNPEGAAKAATAVRRFKDRVEDDAQRGRIEQRLSDLEKLIRASSGGN
jgi:hypothetical protein